VKKQAVIPGQSPKNVDDIVGTPSVEYTYPEVLTSRDGQKAIRIKPSGVTADEYDRQKIEDPAAIIQRDSPRKRCRSRRPLPPRFIKIRLDPDRRVSPDSNDPMVNPPVQERPQERPDEEQLVRQEAPARRPWRRPSRPRSPRASSPSRWVPISLPTRPPPP
jgi:hypothetical protein